MWTTNVQAGNGLGLGIDAGGTQTRWALADAHGKILGEGEVAGLSALQMCTAAGRDTVLATFGTLAKAVLALGRPRRVRAGLTGYDGDGAQMARWLAELLGTQADAISLCNDIEIAYLDSFALGDGYLIYAGTGSIGAWIDSSGQFHRAGGRGVTLDDGGGGYWIAREALRQIWRAEDACPGVWESSPMAQAVFEQIGGSDWNWSRRFMNSQERGEVGKLALAVAATADSDAHARDILQRAGAELARLALALTARYGQRPVALAGRAAGLHPMIVDAMRAALPDGTALRLTTSAAHHAAARSAATAGRVAPAAAHPTDTRR